MSREIGWLASRGVLGVLALTLAPAACSSQEKALQSVPVEQQDLSCSSAAIGPTPLKRLTRFEYANTLRDVFGIDVPSADLFPRDEQALGFDNQAATLSLTDLHVQGYLDAADIVTDWLSERSRNGGLDESRGNRSPRRAPGSKTIARSGRPASSASTIC